MEEIIFLPVEIQLSVHHQLCFNKAIFHRKITYFHKIPITIIRISVSLTKDNLVTSFKREVLKARTPEQKFKVKEKRKSCTMIWFRSTALPKLLLFNRLLSKLTLEAQQVLKKMITSNSCKALARGSINKANLRTILKINRLTNLISPQCKQAFKVKAKKGRHSKGTCPSHRNKWSITNGEPLFNIKMKWTKLSGNKNKFS